MVPAIQLGQAEVDIEEEEEEEGDESILIIPIVKPHTSWRKTSKPD